MMDFDVAVNKLSRNHSRQVRRSRGKKTTNNKSSDGGNSNRLALSEKAKREAEASKRRNEERRRNEKIQKNKGRRIRAYVSKCERELGTVLIRSSDDGNEEENHLYRPTSVHGDGDKITLPVSVLETLMKDIDNNDNNNRSPFEFRVGILNPDYEFPASPALIRMMESARAEDGDDHDGDNDGLDMDDDDDDDDNNDKNKDEFSSTAAFLDELSHKYLAYTHCTVVEFTQEEGHVGIPSAVARALLVPNDSKSSDVPTTRTVDPAKKGIADDDIVTSNTESSSSTPGHLAWGAFDLPDVGVEVTKVTLRKGKGCTLTPTKESLRIGFTNLKDVKAVLEQSLIRTRATLSVNDTVHCWHRGTKFELVVSSVTPADHAAVSCINTDIEVEIGPAVDDDDEKMSDADEVDDETPSPSYPTGRTIGSSDEGPQRQKQHVHHHQQQFTPLPPEPPADQKTNVCTVQIRGDGKTGRRRFDRRTDTVGDLFAFAANVCFDDDNSNSPTPRFRLVTRFPRRVLDNSEADESGGIGDSTSLKEAGIEEGQIVFMVESAS